ncbi:site-specific integrase [Chryseobacterium proteolyticum]|uniref:hypothetical protein n=1 Tax=Chryseobacterium proteolyticum TaxID=118127 RepID=UPI003983B593
MATVKFRVLHQSETAQIYVRLSVSRSVTPQTKIGLTINSKNWSVANAAPIQKTPELKKLAIQLDEFKLHLIKSYNSDYSEGVIFNKAWLDDVVQKYFGRVDDVIENSNTDEGAEEDDNYFSVYLNKHIKFKEGLKETKKEYVNKLKNLRDRFSEFEEQRNHKYLILNVSAEVLANFKNYLIVDCSLAETTSSRFIKNFKTVLFYANDNDGKPLHNKVRGFSPGSTNGEFKIYLNFREIDKVKKVVTLDKDWNTARDWLVIGCFLGQRVGDLFRITNKDIFTKIDYNGITYRFVEVMQEKGAKRVVVPLHSEVESILLKYGGQFPPVFSENEDSNATLFNRYLKKVCEIAGIHDIIKGRMFNEETKKTEIVNAEKCYLISSHACRRSFATNFYGDKNYSTPQLMAITGHTTEAQFLNYIGKTADDWAMQTAKTFRKQSQSKTS